MKYLALFLIIISKVRAKFLTFMYKYLFKKIGKNVIFDPFSNFSYKTIEIGDDVFIGKNAFFQATDSSITIKNKVMFGPNVTIMGGDHRIDVLGEYMIDVKTKLPENDQPVIINEDVWVGANVIILKGVTIGEGSIIAAGSLVNKNVEEYTIVGGVPAKTLKRRFNEEEIITHKQLKN